MPEDYRNKKKEFSDDIEFEDSETFRGSHTTSFKDIILEIYKRCCIEGSKDMTAESGVFNRLVNGVVIEIVVPNQKEIFINNVDILRIALLPIFEKHKKIFYKYIEEYNKRIDELITIRHKQISFIEQKYKNKMHLKDKDYPNLYNLDIKKQNIYFENERVIIHKELLIGISFLLSYLRYFEEEGVTR